MAFGRYDGFVDPSDKKNIGFKQTLWKRKAEYHLKAFKKKTLCFLTILVGQKKTQQQQNTTTKKQPFKNFWTKKKVEKKKQPTTKTKTSVRLTGKPLFKGGLVPTYKGPSRSLWMQREQWLYPQWRQVTSGWFGTHVRLTFWDPNMLQKRSHIDYKM